MLRHLALCAVLAPLLASPGASANGRAPATSSIHFRRGMEREIAAGLTFGLALSRDGGATWSWMCEDAIGYGGIFDPGYELTSSGSLFATAFTGMRVTRDGCRFAPLIAKRFVSAIAQGPDGRLYYGGLDTAPVDSRIYRSDDDGQTWPVSSVPGLAEDWWQSLEVAPSDGNRLYLAGYRYVSSPGGSVKTFLLLRSDDAARTWVSLPASQLATMPNSTIEIAGVSLTDPDLVFARVKLEDNTISDALYRSTDAGMTWMRILGRGSAISFVMRRSGELVAATQALGAVRSTDNGASWVELVNPPHINCLAETSAGEVWACTQNYGDVLSQVPSDGAGIMKSTDLASWSPVLRYQDLKAPVACPAGTVQKDRCDDQLWCGLCEQLGCDAARPSCAPAAAPGPDAGSTDPGDGNGPGARGCCKSSATPAPGALGLVLGIGALLRRPRSRRL